MMLHEHRKDISLLEEELAVNRKRERNKTKSIRNIVCRRDNYICHYCGEFGNTVDHKQPISLNGLTNDANCVCACVECNRRKSNIPYEVYVEIFPIQLRDTN